MEAEENIALLLDCIYDMSQTEIMFGSYLTENWQYDLILFPRGETPQNSQFSLPRWEKIVTRRQNCTLKGL